MKYAKKKTNGGKKTKDCKRTGRPPKDKKKRKLRKPRFGSSAKKQ